jgi:hypothetical protein
MLVQDQRYKALGKYLVRNGRYLMSLYNLDGVDNQNPTSAGLDLIVETDLPG